MSTASEKPEIAKFVLPAGFIVNIEGFPFFLVNETEIEGIEANARLAGIQNP